MRHTCQAWVYEIPAEPKLCGEPAVDFVTITDKGEAQKVWLCAVHWDEWMTYCRERDEEPNVPEK